MSYIVPKEKPKCFNCPFRTLDYCGLLTTLDYCGLLTEHDCVTVNVNEMSVSDYCPLVEIPTPHGRLIDADALKTAFPTSENATNIKVSAVRRAINRMSTIIEAEGSKE
jgi:hypothetical protein